MQVGKQRSERGHDDKKIDRNLPALAELTTEPTIEEISNEVKSILKEDTALSRKASRYLCHRYSRRTLKEIELKGP